MAIHIALLLTLLETLALTGVLLLWGRHVQGARLLVVFLLGVAIWIVANELPNWVGIGSANLAMALGCSLPLTSAAFLHFCWIFCDLSWSRRWLWAAYGIAAVAAVQALVQTPGEFLHFPPFTGVQWVVVPNASGWFASAVWALLAGAGLLVLALGFVRTDSWPRRKQIAAVALSCGWGLASMSGYAFAALGIDAYPWQVLAAPAYPVILVYGILRYSLFVANVWARRTLASAILIVLGLLVVPLMVLLPFESKWLTAAAVAVTCLLLGGPVRHMAARLVYPGGTPSAQDLHQWRSELGQSASMADLEQRASQLVNQRMNLLISVQVLRGGEPLDGSQLRPLRMVCTPRALQSGMPQASGWHTTLQGFDEAPPGQRQLAEWIGTTLAEVAAQVELSELAGQREREKQLQARLAELGSLAATVAHDVRNPLNIIAMAVALAPEETRQEVNLQIARISHLTADLLDYAKPWQVQLELTDLALRVQGLTRHMADVEIGPGLQQSLLAQVDPQRFDQAVVNLLSNARTAAGQRRVWVDAGHTADALQLHVCDDGPGIPEEMQGKLFQPFASRSPGGTGLGLAIVERIMRAHGGSVSLGQRDDWRTCFTLSFPRSEHHP